MTSGSRRRTLKSPGCHGSGACGGGGRSGIVGAMTTVIESPRNPRVKEWSRLHARKGRAETGLFLAEGPHLVEEALRHAPAAVAEILLVEGAAMPKGVSVPQGVRTAILSERAMAAACEADTPQAVAAAKTFKPEKPFRFMGLMT